MAPVASDAMVLAAAGLGLHAAERHAPPQALKPMQPHWAQQRHGQASWVAPCRQARQLWRPPAPPGRQRQPQDHAPPAGQSSTTAEPTPVHAQRAGALQHSIWLRAGHLMVAHAFATVEGPCQVITSLMARSTQLSSQLGSQRRCAWPCRSHTCTSTLRQCAERPCYSQLAWRRTWW